MYAPTRLRLCLAAALAAAVLGIQARAEAHALGPEFVPVLDGIVPPARDLTVTVAPSKIAPLVTLRLRGGGTLEIVDVLGKPFVKVTADGAFLDENSPSAAATLAFRSGGTPRPRSLGGPPRWKRWSDTPEIAYVEPRAEFPGSTPPPDVKAAGTRASIHTWSIAATLDGTALRITGHTDWVPPPFDPTFPLLAGGLASWACCGSCATRRRSSKRTGCPSPVRRSPRPGA